MGLDVYNRLIHACGSRPDGLRRALGLFEEIKADESMEPDAYTYGSLLVSLYLIVLVRAIRLMASCFFTLTGSLRRFCECDCGGRDGV